MGWMSSPFTPTPRSQPLPLRFMLIAGLIAAIGPLSVDMYLPAMPAIQQEFGASPTEIQATMSSYLVGMAFGQLLYGPTSDAWGRKKPLLFGLALYFVAVAGCALATSAEMLTWLRLLQSLGGCAGMVIVRAMIRDRSEPHEMARALSLLTLVIGAAPIVAPLLGGWLFVHLGWRAIFWVLAGYALVAMATLVWGAEETLPQPTGTLTFAYLGRNYARMLRHRRFMGYAVAGSLAQAGAFAYISAAAFLFTEVYGVAAADIGPLFAANAATYVVGSQVNRHLLKRWRAEVLMHAALRAYVAASSLVLLLAVTGWGGLPLMMMALAACLATMGFTFPNSTAVALAPFGDRAGMAASLMGTLQFGVAGAVSWGLAHAHSRSGLPMAVAMLGCAVAAWATLKLLVKRPTGPAPPPQKTLRLP